MADVIPDSAAVERNYQLTPTDLDILFEVASVPTDPYEVLFDLYDETSPSPVLINPPNRTPNRLAAGHFFAPWYVPADAAFGAHRIDWKYRINIADPQSVEPELFFVVVQKLANPSLTPDQDYWVNQIRLYLRDARPDEYHFVPPTGEGTIKAFNTVNGYIWKDEDIVAALGWAVGEINALPPRAMTFTLATLRDMTNTYSQRLTGIFVLRTAAFCLDMLANYWTAEGFSYSINGISLDLNKAEMYRSMKEMTMQQYRDSVEDYKKTVKLGVGLRPSYYFLSAGLSGSMLLGPRTSGRNVRNYVRR